MDDFRLRVFITAAKTLNFTKCAEQLFISQPAVSKHIGELESPAIRYSFSSAAAAVWR